MLSVRDVPHEIEETYKQCKNLARKVYQALEKYAQQQRLPSNQDLLPVVGHDKIAFIREGYFKLHHIGKAVRLYSEGDFIASDPAFKKYRLSSDLGCEIALFDRAKLLKAVSASQKIQDDFLALIERNPHLMISTSKTLAKRLVELNEKLAAP